MLYALAGLVVAGCGASATDQSAAGGNPVRCDSESVHVDLAPAQQGTYDGGGFDLRFRNDGRTSCVQATPPYVYLDSGYGPEPAIDGRHDRTFRSAARLRRWLSITLRRWVPHQPWLGRADASSLTKLGSYRFDDPDGEVGMETHLLGTADGQVLQVPLTYRGAPLPGAEGSLITTMTHTSLGDRWIYDGCHDPVYVTALVRAILNGGREADVYAATDEGLVREPATTHVRGSGSLPLAGVPALTAPVVHHHGTTTTIDVGVRLTLQRVILTTTPAANSALSGTWPGQDSPVVLATVDGSS